MAEYAQQIHGSWISDFIDLIQGPFSAHMVLLASPLRQSSWFQFGITHLSAGPAASVTNIGTTPSGYHLRRASPLSIQWFSSLTGHTSLHFDDSQVFARITFTLLSPRLGIFFLSPYRCPFGAGRRFLYLFFRICTHCDT